MSKAHDRAKPRLLGVGECPWLHGLGITTVDGQVGKGMEAKFRQMHKFVEVLGHLLADAPAWPKPAFRLVDMGCGKGYLTFAAFEFLRRSGWTEARVTGIEARAELVELCNRVAQENGCAGLAFESGRIADAAFDSADAVLALHACDTATDDAIARGIETGAALIVVAPCCHQELRPLLVPPPVLAGALRHGLLRERQAEFVTDALRAALLEWAGYDTKIFEFISTEHTAKNLMIAATRRDRTDGKADAARRVRDLAAFYGVRTQHLAAKLGFALGHGHEGSPDG